MRPRGSSRCRLFAVFGSAKKHRKLRQQNVSRETFSKYVPPILNILRRFFKSSGSNCSGVPVLAASLERLVQTMRTGSAGTAAVSQTAGCVYLPASKNTNRASARIFVSSEWCRGDAPARDTDGAPHLRLRRARSLAYSHVTTMVPRITTCRSHDGGLA
jgi:hypothetical protein